MQMSPLSSYEQRTGDIYCDRGRMNQRNLQKELEKVIRQNQEKNIHPKLLLHVCCAPCSSYCMEYLHEEFELTVFYYNPNIDNIEEYQLRLEEEKRLISRMPFKKEVKFMEGRYNPSDFHQMARGLETQKEGGTRCLGCFEMRLREAAKIAAEYGFDYFTTALSISPMKNSTTLAEIGEKVGKEYGVKYLPSDFKKKNGFKRSLELSEEFRLYRQNYCGCSFSKREAKERERIGQEDAKVHGVG